MKLDKIATFYCAGFGIGFFPKAPGTLASLAILPLVWFIKPQISVFSFIACLLIYFIISYLFLKKILINKKDMDPKFVVCDEYLGQSVALMCCNQELLDFLIAFVLFRIFDIKKPFPVSYFDNQKNIYGVLMDDVAAGILVNIFFLIYYAI